MAESDTGAKPLKKGVTDCRQEVGRFGRAMDGIAARRRPVSGHGRAKSEDSRQEAWRSPTRMLERPGGQDVRKGRERPGGISARTGSAPFSSFFLLSLMILNNKLVFCN